jgi:predicted methyltransferase
MVRQMLTTPGAVTTSCCRDNCVAVFLDSTTFTQSTGKNGMDTVIASFVSRPGPSAESIPEYARMPRRQRNAWAGFCRVSTSPRDASQSSIVDATDRSPDDRLLDRNRMPAELLGFLGIRRGWRVADLGAGEGYTTELLRRAVGSEGMVYGQNSASFLEPRLEKSWRARLAKPLMRNVVRVDREFDAPFPPGLLALDAVTLMLFYHDVVRTGANRNAMNSAVFAALKPGGVFLIADHSARAGKGVKVVDVLHRIEEIVVKSEVQAVGFRFDGEAEFLRNPEDARDWNVSPFAADKRRGTSDRFVLRFRKP